MKFNKLIPYSRQAIDNKDITNVVKVLKSDLLTKGKKLTNLKKNQKSFFDQNSQLVLSMLAWHFICLAEQ